MVRDFSRYTDWINWMAEFSLHSNFNHENNFIICGDFLALNTYSLSQQKYFEENRIIGGIIMELLLGLTVLAVIAFLSYEAYLSAQN